MGMHSSTQRKSVAVANDVENQWHPPHDELKYSSGNSEATGSDGEEAEEELLLLRGVKIKPVSGQQRRNAIAACLSYSFCSVCMALVNKSLASSEHQVTVQNNFNTLLVAFQAFVSLVCIHLCLRSKRIEFPTLTAATARCWAPVTLCFCLVVYTSITAWQTTNSIRIVILFKSVSNLYITAGDYWFFGNRPSDLVMVSLSFLLVGAAAAASNDIAVTAWNGLGWMVANCVCTTAYVINLKRATQTIQLSKFGMVYINSLLCLLFLLPVAWYRGEVARFVNTAAIHTTGYFLKTVFAGVTGFALTLASSHCISATSPTTYAVVGSISNIQVALLGWLMFDGSTAGKVWIFIGLSMLLGGWLLSFIAIQSPDREHNKSEKAAQHLGHPVSR